MKVLLEAVNKAKLKKIVSKIDSKVKSHPKIKKIISSFNSGNIPSNDIKKLSQDLQDEITMAMAEVLGPNETSKLIGEGVKTIKVGEDAVIGEDPHYVLVKKREVIAAGTKEDMLEKCEKEGGRVWLSIKEIGELVEMTGASMNTRKLHRHLKKNGWSLSRSKGNHDVFEHPKKKEHVSVPRHKDIKAPVMLGILKKAGLKEDILNEVAVGKTYHMKDSNTGQKKKVHVIKYEKGPHLPRSLVHYKRHGETKIRKMSSNLFSNRIKEENDIISFSESLQDKMKQRKLENLRKKAEKGDQRATKEVEKLEKELGVLSKDKKAQSRNVVTSSDKEDGNIIMQLRAAQDVGGKKDIKFRRGSGRIDKSSIDFLLKLFDALNPEGKRRLQIMVGKSLKDMKHVIDQYRSRLREDNDEFLEILFKEMIVEMRSQINEIGNFREPSDAEHKKAKEIVKKKFGKDRHISGIGIHKKTGHIHITHTGFKDYKDQKDHVIKK